MQQIIWRLIHPPQKKHCLSEHHGQLHQLNQWREFMVELSVWLINETGGIENNNFCISILFSDNCGTEITHHLHHISVCKGKKLLIKNSNMCRLLGDSPLNNVLDIISNFKQIIK